MKGPLENMAPNMPLKNQSRIRPPWYLFQSVQETFSSEPGILPPFLSNYCSTFSFSTKVDVSDGEREGGFIFENPVFISRGSAI